MSCPRFEKTCLALGEPGLSVAERAELADHLDRCEDCNGARRVRETLRRAEALFGVRDPGRAYWDSFGARLAARIDERSRARLLRIVTGSPERVALAIAACALLALSLTAIEVSRRETGFQTVWSAAAKSPPAEAELIARLQEFDPARLDHALDDLLPEPPPSADDLGALDPSIVPEALPTPPDESPYDIFLDLSGEERSRLLKEMRGEIG